jgi:hypothetical protein
MEPVIVQAFQSLLVAVVVAIIALIGTYIKKAIALLGVYLEQKLGLATFNFVKDYVATSVRFVEQSPQFKELTSKEKLSQVMNDVSTWCQARNIPIDAGLIERMTEEAVQIMNSTAPQSGGLSGIGNLAEYVAKPMITLEAK